VLTVVPWTDYWDHNYFVSLFPSLETLLISHAVRGGVSGIGILSFIVALADVVGTIRRLIALRVGLEH